MNRTKPQWDEGSILEGCRENDRFAQEQFYRRFFQPMVRMVLRYTKDRDVALEIVNNGFLRAFKKIDKYSGKGSLEGWLRKLVFHALSDYFKKAKSDIHFLNLEEWDAIRQDSPTDQLYYDDLVKLINELPDASRRVFYLYAIEGYSHAEIAELQQISIGTSKWHLSNARKILKQLIVKMYNPQQHAGG